MLRQLKVCKAQQGRSECLPSGMDGTVGFRACGVLIGLMLFADFLWCSAAYMYPLAGHDVSQFLPALGVEIATSLG